jgi:hypothetical protein
MISHKRHSLTPAGFFLLLCPVQPTAARLTLSLTFAKSHSPTPSAMQAMHARFAFLWLAGFDCALHIGTMLHRDMKPCGQALRNDGGAAGLHAALSYRSTAMLIFNAMRDFADGLVRGVGLYFNERDPQALGRLFPDNAARRR